MNDWWCLIIFLQTLYFYQQLISTVLIIIGSKLNNRSDIMTVIGVDHPTVLKLLSIHVKLGELIEDLKEVQDDFPMGVQDDITDDLEDMIKTAYEMLDAVSTPLAEEYPDIWVETTDDEDDEDEVGEEQLFDVEEYDGEDGDGDYADNEEYGEEDDMESMETIEEEEYEGEDGDYVDNEEYGTGASWSDDEDENNVGSGWTESDELSVLEAEEEDDLGMAEWDVANQTQAFMKAAAIAAIIKAISKKTK